MEMDQLKALFRSQGLTVHVHIRRKGLRYIYASWREGKKIRQVYFAPELKVAQMTSEQVQEKLALLKK